MKAIEMMHEDISNSIGNLIDVQELAARHKVNDCSLISQEAGKVIEALRELENLLHADKAPTLSLAELKTRVPIKDAKEQAGK